MVEQMVEGRLDVICPSRTASPSARELRVGPPPRGYSPGRTVTTQEEALMADRAQRVRGKAQETKGRLKREAGIASGRPATETRGAAEELKGKSRNTVGKARSAVKKKTR
jgi:uncharacterized protein YjbJ (UPF0337 family)